MVFKQSMTPRKAGYNYRNVLLLGLLALAQVEGFAALDTKAHSNPYLAIIKRNAFDLTGTPPPVKNTPPPEPPKDLDLKFTGIYRLKGVERACLALIDSSAKPPETKYLQIPVGDKQDSIEITAINAESGIVNLIKDGKPLELSLKNDEHTYKTAVAKAPSKSSKSRSSSSKTPSKTSSRSSSSSRPTSGRNAGATSSRSGGASRTSSSRLETHSPSSSTRAVPTRARRTYPSPPPMQGADPTVQALEMIHQKDSVESQGVPMPPLPFGGELNEGQPSDSLPNDRPPLPPGPGVSPLPPGPPNG